MTTAVLPDLSVIGAALNDDPEFRLMARLWTARLVLEIGDDRYLVEVRDGEVARFTDRVTLFDSFDIRIGGSTDGWTRLLALEPEPMYQDLFPAVLHRGFTMGGDLESLFAYFPAVRRMWDVIRVLRAKNDN